MQNKSGSFTPTHSKPQTKPNGNSKPALARTASRFNRGGGEEPLKDVHRGYSMTKTTGKWPADVSLTKKSTDIQVKLQGNLTSNKVNKKNLESFQAFTNARIASKTYRDAPDQNKTGSYDASYGLDSLVAIDEEKPGNRYQEAQALHRHDFDNSRLNASQMTDLDQSLTPFVTTSQVIKGAQSSLSKQADKIWKAQTALSAATDTKKSGSSGDGTTATGNIISAKTCSSWKDKLDRNQVYSLNKKLELTDCRDEHVREISRWRFNDDKGNRRSYHVKEAARKNRAIMTIVNQSRLDQVANYKDGYACLGLRKKIMRLRVLVSETAISITRTRYFESFIILIIGLNCITLAQSDNTKEETEMDKKIEMAFQVIYTVEMVLRIFSLGFVFNKGAYLRSYWNILDFVCVITGFIGMLGGSDTSIAGIRAFRVLRPLRTVNQIDGLRTVVQSVMGAVALLQDTILILVFFMLIFAIGGLNLFMGLLLQRCVSADTGAILLDAGGEEVLCGNSECPTGFYCGKRTLNPNNDVTNFDNIFWALLNVFQCITLEGWSDIMVMLQKTYSPFVIFFFVGLVFIGAFFFLNLTLAVINSSYSEAQARIKAQKAKMRQEQINMTSQAQKPDDDNNLAKVIAAEEEQQAARNTLGVAEFFTAKRAAAKLIAFWKHDMAQKEKEREEARIRKVEEKRAAKKAEEAADARRAQILQKQRSLRKKKGLGKSESMTSQNSLEGLNSSKITPIEEDFTKEGVVVQEMNASDRSLALTDNNIDEKVMEQVLQRNATVKPIEEAGIFSEEEDQFQEDVRNFLKEVNEKDQSASVTPMGTLVASKPVVNAFSDVRISRPVNESRLRLTAMSTRKDASALKIQTLQYDERSESDQAQKNEILQALDFDKVFRDVEALGDVIAETPLKQQQSKTQRESKARMTLHEQHPFDLSFVNEQDRGYLESVSDDEPQKRVMAPLTANNQIVEQILEQDLISSVVLSDDSEPIEKTRLPSNRNNKSALDVGQSAQEKLSLSMQKSRETKQALRRMFTQDFDKEKEGFARLDEQSNDSQKFKDHMPGLKESIDLLSSLIVDEPSPARRAASPDRGKRSLNITGMTDMSAFKGSAKGSARGSVRGSTTKSPKRKLKTAYFKRKERLDIYNQVDPSLFGQDASVNPDDFIDKVKQKVTINPGVPYVSSSQAEIFERRIQQNETAKLKQMNPYIQQTKQDQELLQSRYETEEEIFIQSSQFEPYQLKAANKIRVVDEIDFSSLQEDALILAQQPFETVMQTSFKDYLNHLNTKFIARRSDIIVSSTLSITLTPQDDGYVPCKFALIDQDQVQEYTRTRSLHRATFVETNHLPKGRANQRGSKPTLDYHLTSLSQQYDAHTESSSEDEDEDLDEAEVEQEGEEAGDGDLPEEFKQSLKKEGLQRSLKRQQSIRDKDKPTRLPPTLCTKPLAPQQVARLRPRDKKIYNLQKSKYDVTQKMLSKRLVPLAETKLTMDDLRDLVSGKFYQEEAEMDAEMAQPNTDLNQTMAASNKAALQNELKLQGFQESMALQQDRIEREFEASDPRRVGDNVPTEIKECFNLPADMSRFDIDYEEVKRTDMMFKKQIQVWSGQDVLELGLNMEKGHWVLSKMNAMRVWPKGLYNPIKKVRNMLKYFVRMSLFENAMTLSVLANTIGMAMDSYDIDAQLKTDLEYMNTIFTWVFIVEMGLKLLARGPKKYSAERMNLLDGAVVSISVIEMIMESLGSGGGTGNLQAFRTVRVFRTFRVLRVTRILRALKSMATIMEVIALAYMDFIWITLLMFVFIFIYALLGRQIFQGQYSFEQDEELPRANYESFTIAFITVFQVLTMENWQQVLFASMRAARGSMIFKATTAIYYISWIFIGNFILLNLFLAILIDSFNEADAEMENEEDTLMAEEEKQKRNQQFLKDEMAKRVKKIGAQKVEIGREVKTKNKKKKPKASFTGRKAINEDLVEDVEDMDDQAVRRLLIEQGILKAKKGEVDEKEIGPDIEAEHSVYLFGRKSCFRRNVFYVQKHRYFDRFIMLLIALSSTKLALESYFVDEPEDSLLVQVSERLDLAFNYLFIMEACLKVIALGFAMDEGSYLRDSWNGLDFFIVVTTLFDMLLAGADIPALKVLRLLRMIRPLRVISHNPQLKMIVAALFESVGSIINVSFVVMIVWLMFAIYGMNTYMGMFFYCSEDKYLLNTQWVCEEAGGTWMRFDSNFDNIGEAMVTLFIVSSLEGWPDIMHQAIDITKRDNGPAHENSTGQMGFFILFILIGSFFFLNFFIGVLFLKYEQAQKKEEAGFTKEQLYWLELQRLIVAAKTPHELRYKPQFGPRLALWKVVQSDTFDVAIMVCIVLNMLQMALDHEGAGPGMIMFLRISNYFFTGVFLIECILKLYVYRAPYFKTAWNKFDFFVVASSLIDLALEVALPVPEGGNQQNDTSSILSVGPQLARVLRVLRVSRILRLAGKYKGLQSLLKTIQMSVSSLINVFILLMLIFFIMAVLGNSLFYRVTEGNVIDEWKNFTNFHMSFSLLFSISTGEDWNRIMYDCMRTGPDCVPGKTCGTDIAPGFFLVFILIVTHIMLNLFILVIIQQFSKYYIEEDNPLERFETDFEDFKEAWKNFTGQYQCTRLRVKHVGAFFTQLPFRILNNINEGGQTEGLKGADVQRIILKMGIVVEGDFIYFNEMLYRVMRAQFGRVPFNKVMALNELVTQYRITALTHQTKSEKSLNKKQLDAAFFSQRSSKPVNPFLDRMFYALSFRTWHAQMLRTLKKYTWDAEVDKKRQKFAAIGKEFKEPVYVWPETPCEEVEIERDIYLEISCDSDEVEEELDYRSRRSWQASSQNHLSRTSFKSQTPSMFRQRAKSRLFRKESRFTMIIEEVEREGEVSPNVVKKPPRKSMKKLLSVDDMAWLDPNSFRSQALAISFKINKHQKQKNMEMKKEELRYTDNIVSQVERRDPLSKGGPIRRSMTKNDDSQFDADL